MANTVLESERWRVLELDHGADVMEYSKSCGWCTDKFVHAEQYLNHGRLFVLFDLEKSHRRPWSQLFIPYSPQRRKEWKRRGNRPVWETAFIAITESCPVLTAWLKEMGIDHWPPNTALDVSGFVAPVTNRAHRLRAELRDSIYSRMDFDDSGIRSTISSHLQDIAFRRLRLFSDLPNDVKRVIVQTNRSIVRNYLASHLAESWLRQYDEHGPGGSIIEIVSIDGEYSGCRRKSYSYQTINCSPPQSLAFQKNLSPLTEIATQRIEPAMVACSDKSPPRNRYDQVLYLAERYADALLQAYYSSEPSGHRPIFISLDHASDGWLALMISRSGHDTGTFVDPEIHCPVPLQELEHNLQT